MKPAGERLPQGITGFRSKEDPELPRVDPSAFRALCHDLARRAKGTVAGFDVDLKGILRNFYQGLLLVGGDPIQILCNEIHPWLAAAAFVQEEDGQLSSHEHSFRAPPAWLLSAEDSGFRVLGLELLEAPVRRDDVWLSALPAVELKQIRYWAPRRVGDIIFNLWD